MDTPRKAGFSSKKSRLVVWVTLPLVLMLAISGTVSLYAVYSENQTRVTQQLSDEARLASHDVNALFLRCMTIVEMADIIPAFEEYFHALSDRKTVFTNHTYYTLREIIDNIQAASRGQFLSTWVCDLDSNYLFQSSNAPWESDAEWKASTRPWYPTALRLKRPFLTSPYAESATGTYVISFICPVTNTTTGEVIGVFGADISLDQLTPLMQGAPVSGQERLMLVAPDGYLVYHTDSTKSHKQFTELNYSANIVEAVKNRTAGSYSFTLAGEPMQGTVSVLSSHWVVLSELSQRAIDSLVAGTATVLWVSFLLVLLLLLGSLLVVRQLLRKQEKNETYLEDQIARRTQSLLKQDAMLWTVNDIAKKLLTTGRGEPFAAVINECLHMIGETTARNRVYIWKDVRNSAGELCCTQVNEWVREVAPIQGESAFANIPYTVLPSFLQALEKEECLNSFVRDLTPSEKDTLEPQGIVSLLIAPIVIDGMRWGFIGMDNCESLELFSDLEKNILLTSGFMLASAILKQNTENQLREAEELTQTLLDAMPLACSMWNKERQPVFSNAGGLRLFGLSSQEDFQERFYDLSPPDQPCGRPSRELIDEIFTTAFQTGLCTFEWTHQNLAGEAIPAHVTLVRLRFKNTDVVASYVRDLRELKAQEAQRHEAEERTRLMLNAMPLCCNFWDKNFNNLACNDAATRLFDLASQEDYLECFARLSPPVQPDGSPSGELALKKITQAFEEGYARFEWLHQRLDGTPIPCEITLVRMVHKNDHIVVGYTRDLRELKTMLEEVRKVQQELALARDEAVAHSRTKSEFLAKMSHEIRTPMNAIVGMSELILREGIPPKAEEHAVAIKQAGAHLLSIINDILDFSKIESGKLEISPCEYLFASLLNDTINIIRVRMMEKPIIFAVNVDPNLPNALVGDDIRIRQILLNVLNNAVKYTEEGFITLTIDGEKLDATTMRLRMTVADSGVGIKEDDLERLFGQFVQFDSDKHKGVEGTGLGLAITRSLCRAMGGDIAVSSVYGEGSVFTVTLLQEYTGPDCLATVEHPEQKTVLLYEPRKVIANSLVRSLETLSVPCTLVTNQSELYERLNQSHYQFIFMSNFMFETARNILEHLHCVKDTVVLTEHGEVIANKDIKTVSMPLYVITIANVLNGIWESQHTDANDMNIRFIAPSARILVVDDINTNLKVAEGLMAPYGMNIELCECGADAVERVRTTAYDLVFMDHMMPGMNGIEATLAIRELPVGKDLPIIALTANAVSGMKEVFLSNGFNDFLAKPIETSKLNALLERWIPKEKQEKYTAVAPTPDADTPAFAIDGVNVERGLAMTGGSMDNYLKILAMYHKDGTARLPEIRRALAADDYPLFATYVHALKSASASIGAASVSDFAKQLEAAANRKEVFFLQEYTETFLAEFSHLLDNIGYVVMTAEDESPKETMSDEQLGEALAHLREALENMDAMSADTYLNTLQTRNRGSAVAGPLEQIAQHILMCEYDEAVAVIDTLISARTT